VLPDAVPSASVRLLLRRLDQERIADQLRHFPALADTVCREEASKGRQTGVFSTHPQVTLLPAHYRASIVEQKLRS
jgi:hypothetical protein